jgi:hypothetical protein
MGVPLSTGQAHARPASRLVVCPRHVGAGAVSAQSSAAPTSVATPRVSSSGVRIVPRAIKKPASFDAGFFDSL